MDKKQLSERDICTKFITPALEQAGWDIQRQIREEVTFTAGRVIVRKKMVSRGKAKRADYILYHKPNIPIALIEAKDNKHSVGAGMQQALGYAASLDIPFVYSSNGDAFLEHDRTVKSGPPERELPLDSFPSPEELWDKYRLWKGINKSREKIYTQDYYFDPGGKTPRYFQRIAINRTIEAIAAEQKRILLVMATGTGKTYTAFQIIYRLWKAGIKKRILFLADRNVLIDQTMSNDFKPFEGKMTKIKNRKADKSYEIYMALYQGISGSEEFQNIYKQFSPDFFDLIIIDECHRGSAREDSAWREILEYYQSATQIGLTATPRETKEISNTDYFGPPIYTYSLRQGIEDGFLAPYKVIRVHLDKDLEGYRPEKGKLDKYGNLIEDREYNTKDYDRNLILEKRTEVVARKVSQHLKENNTRFAKSIFFCVDIDHAERMRRCLVNENPDLVAENPKYVMRITGDDEEEGKKELDNFIAPDSIYPVLTTTSKLMTTGVDAQTCKYIILDSVINSMTEFKQIIGRGTRICEDYDKLYFTIIDFRGVTKLFADPAFDGDPVKIEESDHIPGEDEEETGEDTDTADEFPEDEESTGDDFPDIGINEGEEGGIIRYYVNDVEVRVIHQSVYYYDKDGKLITESLRDYTRKNIRSEFKTLDTFLNRWSTADKKEVIIAELEEKGIFLDELQEETGKDMDPFDLICHVAFDRPALTRKERAENFRKKDYFARYGETAKEILSILLEKYADEGLDNLESMDVLHIPEFRQYGRPKEIIDRFGGKDKFLKALQEMKKILYSA